MNSRLVEKWMIDNGVTRSEMADKLDVNETTFWRHMVGRNVNKTFVLAVSAITGLPMNELLKPTRGIGGTLRCPTCNSTLAGKKTA